MKMEFEKIVAERLTVARKEAELKQADAAAYLDMSQSAISKIEKGDLTANPNIIGNLAELYGISIDWLFGLGQRRKE